MLLSVMHCINASTTMGIVVFGVLAIYSATSGRSKSPWIMSVSLSHVLVSWSALYLMFSSCHLPTQNGHTAFTRTLHSSSR